MNKEWFLIWSNEHRAWWMPGSRGYTTLADRAGRYTREQALSICNGANYGWDEDTLPNELPILESVAVELAGGWAA
jgi:hypothetical protein